MQTLIIPKAKAKKYFRLQGFLCACMDFGSVMSVSIFIIGGKDNTFNFVCAKKMED
jgi:hypothetical protein